MITYDSATTILNAARQRLLDTLPSLQAISGSILDRTQGWTQQAFNTAWRRLQSILAGNAESGFQGLKVDTIISSFPTVAPANDPAVQQTIDLSGTFDGTTQTSTPALPSNLIEPLEVWERIHNAGSPTDFLEMDKLLHAIPNVTKSQWNRFWQWRQDTLCLPGSTVLMDLRIFYNAFLPDIVDVTTGTPSPWYLQSVPISRCLDALSFMVAAEYLGAQADPEMAQKAQAFNEQGMAAAMLIGARDTANVRMARKESVLGSAGGPAEEE